MEIKNRLSEKLNERKDTFITPWWPAELCVIKEAPASSRLASKHEQIFSRLSWRSGRKRLHTSLNLVTVTRECNRK